MARPRIPTGIKKQIGYRKDRINDSEPRPDGPLGIPPEWLDEVGVSAWYRVGKELEAMKVGTSADAELLAVYCDAFADWMAARADLKRNGLTITTETTTKTNPAYGIKSEAQRTMTRILAHFGMSPSARAALHVEREADANPLLAFMADGEPDGP